MYINLDLSFYYSCVSCHMSVEKEKLVWLFQHDSLFQSGKKKLKILRFLLKHKLPTQKRIDWSVKKRSDIPGVMLRHSLSVQRRINYGILEVDLARSRQIGHSSIPDI